LKFTEFGFADELLESIEAIGFEEATPVQAQTIPPILEGKDMIASAQTGTGKTAAFLLPIINQIITGKSNDNVKAIVVVPTRELAVQIDQQMQGFSYFTPISSISVYGGRDGASFAQEKEALVNGVDVVIGTPGKLIAHLNMGYIKMESFKHLILDEADRMLDMGFFEDILRIISFLPKERQNLLFSATMPPKIRELARKVLVKPEEINIAISRPAEKVLQLAYVLYEEQKIKLVAEQVKSEHLNSAIVFCSTKSSAKILSKELKRMKLSIEDIHSDLDQKEREEVLLAFKNKRLKILVATDIISRGIDIEDIDLVINYDVPNDEEDYIHRIGRTARAESEGVAITLISEKEQYKFGAIENLLGEQVYKAPLLAEFGETPEYDPKKKPKGNFKKNNFKKPGNKKPYNKGKKNYKPKKDKE